MKLATLGIICINIFNKVYADQKNDEESPTQIPKYQSVCKFYLAESSIPNAGFGVYTVENMKKNEYLTEVPDAPSIVVVDELWHSPDIVSNHCDYYW